jgi:high-affinity Fe2+/Pb2+ permease
MTGKLNPSPTTPQYGRAMMAKGLALVAGACVGIAAAVLLLMLMSVLDGVVDPNRGLGRLLVIFAASFALIVSAGLGVAAYRYVMERATRREVRNSN